MPRKAESQTEETTLRRSTRATAVNGNAGTPSSVKTRRGSLLAQDNDEDNGETKATPRTRRAASLTKEEPPSKPEPAKTRARRSSAASELPPAEEKRPTTRGRRASTTEESADTPSQESAATTTTTRKSIRSRRSSAQDDKVEEQSPVPAKTLQRRKSVNTENEETKPKVTRSRRLSVEKSEEVTEEPPKRATRTTRRSSVDKAEDEPEAKLAKPGTPKKPKRRPSVTEVVIPLEPIDEQETELVKRNGDTSPVADKVPVVKLTPVKKVEPKKTDLDLSIINESSFVEEAEASPKNGKLDASASPGELAARIESVPPLVSPLKSPEVSSKIQLTPLQTKNSPKVTPDPPTPIVLASKDVEVRLGARKVSPRINKNSITPQKLFLEDKEQHILSVKNIEDDPVFDSPSTVTSVQTPKSPNTLISSGSDGSFSLHLSASLVKSKSQDSASDLNLSGDSDKENNRSSGEEVERKTMYEPQEIRKTEPYTVARVSNVFRPKNIDCSFMEPMEVDKTIVETKTKLDDGGENINKELIEDNKDEKTEVETNVPNACDNGDDKLEVNTKSNESVLEISFKSADENLEITDHKLDEDNEAFVSAVAGTKEPSSTAEKTSKTEDPIEKKTMEEASLKTGSMPTILVTQDASVSENKDGEGSKLETVPDEVTKQADKQNAVGSPRVDEQEISPDEEAKLLEDSLNETTTNSNKEDASQDFEFNIPSDEENEDEQTKAESEKTSELPKESEKEADSMKDEEKDAEHAIKADDKPDSNEKETESSVISEKKSVENQLASSGASRECETTTEKNKSEEAITENKERIGESDNTVDVDKETSENSVVPTKEKIITNVISDQEVGKETSDVSIVEDNSQVDDIEKTTTKVETETSIISDSKMEVQIAEKKSIEIDQETSETSKTEPSNAIEIEKTGEIVTDVKDSNKTDADKPKTDQEIQETTDHKETPLDSNKKDVAVSEAHSEKIDEEMDVSEVLVKEDSPSNDQVLKSTAKETSSSDIQDSKSENEPTAEVNDQKDIQEDNTELTKAIPVEKMPTNTEPPEPKDEVDGSNIVMECTLADQEKSVAPDENKTAPDLPEKVTPDTPSIVAESSSITLEEGSSIAKETSAVTDEIITAVESILKETQETSLSKEMSTVSHDTIAAESTVEEPADHSIPKEVPTADTIIAAKSTSEEPADHSIPKEVPAAGTIIAAQSTSEEPADHSIPKEVPATDTIIAAKSTSEEPADHSTPNEISAVSDENETAADLTEAVTSKAPTEVESTSIESSLSREISVDQKQTSVKLPETVTEIANEAESTSEKPEQRENEDVSLESEHNTSAPSAIEITVTANERIVREKGKKHKKKKSIVIEDSDDAIETIEIEDDVVEIESNSTGAVEHTNTVESVQILEEDIFKDSKPKKEKKNKRKIDENNEEIDETELPSKKKRAKTSATESCVEEVEKSKKKGKKIKNKSTSSISNEDEIEHNSSLNSSGKKLKKKCKKSRKSEDEDERDEIFVTNKSRPKKGKYVLSPRKADSPLTKLDRYLDENMEDSEKEEEEDVDDEESDVDRNSFIDDMAEEGEEDTPSDDSNDIIDEGESINTTESEWSDDDYDDDDSFICDEEKVELLSGEEYDLDDAPEVKQKKSRIIDVDSIDEDVIKIEKKPRKVVNKKPRKSRIINIEDCEEEIINVNKKITTPQRSKRPRLAQKEEPNVDEENQVDDEEGADESDKIEDEGEGTETESSSVEIVEAESESTEDDSGNAESTVYEVSQGKEVEETNEGVQDKTRVRRASITIQENIKVGDIQDPVLSTRINQLVDSFSKTITKGDVSVNLSMQFEGSDSSDVVCTDDLIPSGATRKDKRVSLNRSSRRNNEDLDGMEGTPAKKPRLSVSLNDEDVSSEEEDNKASTSRKRMSVSIDDIQMKKMHKKKLRKAQKKAKNDLLRGVHEKAIKRKSFSTDELRTETFNIMNQLLNDVRNRPRRIVKPSIAKPDPNSSWVVDDITEVKPSTSIITTKDIEEFKAKKVHMKDFKTQMLNDPSRVRRVDTKTLLKKKLA